MSLEAGATTPFDIVRNVTISNLANFNAFSTSLLVDDTAILNMDATVSVHAAGLKYSSIPFKKAIVLTGLSGFRTLPVAVTNQTIYKGTETQLLSQLMVTMHNPSPVSMEGLGLVTLDVYVKDKHIGTASTSHFNLPLASPDQPQGFTSPWDVVITLIKDGTANNEVEIQDVMSAYANGENIQLEMRGNVNSTSLRLLKAAFSALRIPTTLPG